MEVIYDNIDKNLLSGGVACALGFFDGVHIGHANLLSDLKSISKRLGLKSLIFTFRKHPLTILDSRNAQRLITDNNIKTRIFSGYGIDIVNYNSVTPDFLNMEPESFFKDILVGKFNVQAIITGFNFRFGLKGRGNSDLLKDLGKLMGMYIDIVNPVCIDDIVVSSTAIRNFLASGNINKANQFLGRCYSLSGEVVHGKRRGHELGFPTANLSVNQELITPKSGVYITKVDVDGVLRTGVTNVGYNPTFGHNPISIETHIIDYTGDIYGKSITVGYSTD
jgi:riboflavin kinase/FMN adenylyltransferase